ADLDVAVELGARIDDRARVDGGHLARSLGTRSGAAVAVAAAFAVAVGRPDLAQRAHQLGLGGDLAVDGGLARVLPDRARDAHDLDLEPELVAGNDRSLEAGAVDAD